MDDDLKQLVELVAQIAAGNAEAVASGDSDVIGEIEADALMAAAHSFATYQLVRALRREYDARQAQQQQQTHADENLN